MKLTSQKAYRVAKHILEYPEFGQRELHRQTDVALGYVNEIVNYLLDVGVVAKKSGHYSLNDPVKLLDKISFDRPFKKLKIAELRLPTTSIQESEQFLAESFRVNKTEYVFTVFSGLRRYFEYHITYPMVHVYVADLGVVDELVQGEGAVPVILLEADRSDIFEDSREVQGFKVCDRIQIVIDLFSSGIGRDAAIKYLEAIQHGDNSNPG